MAKFGATTYSEFVEKRFNARRVRLVHLSRLFTLLFACAILAWMAVIVTWSGTPKADGWLVALPVLAVLAGLAALFHLERWATLLASVLHVRSTHERHAELLLNGRYYDPDEGWVGKEHNPQEPAVRTFDAERRVAALDLAAQFAPKSDFASMDGHPTRHQFLKAPIDDPKLREWVTTFVGRCRLFGGACAFCGHPHAPIVCGQCNSIQWGDLEPRNLGDHLPDWSWGWAVFISHFRFELLAAVVPALFLTTGPAFYSAFDAHHTERERAHEQLFSDSKEFINATVAFRWRLADYARMCTGEVGGAIKGAVGGVTQAPTNDEGMTALQSDCRKLLFDFDENYMKFSWYGQTVFTQLLADQCLKTEEPERQAACRVLETNHVALIDAADANYRELNTSLWDKTPDRRQQLRLADELYHIAKVVSCAVSVATDGRDQTQPMSENTCITAINGYLERLEEPGMGGDDAMLHGARKAVYPGWETDCNKEPTSWACW